MDGGRRTADAARRTDIWITKSLPELSSGETKSLANRGPKLRPLKLDSVFSITFLSAHNEATFSLFIIFIVSISHQYQPFRMYIKDLNPT